MAMYPVVVEAFHQNYTKCQIAGGVRGKVRVLPPSLVGSHPLKTMTVLSRI